MNGNVISRIKIPDSKLAREASQWTVRAISDHQIGAWRIVSGTTGSNSPIDLRA